MEFTDTTATDKSAALKDFCHTLEQLSDIAEKISKLEESKADAASQKQHQLIDGYLQEEQALMLRLRGLEQIRIKQTDALGWKDFTFRQILECAEDWQREPLTPLFDDLSNKLKKLTSSKDSADRIISLRLREFEGILAGINPPHLHDTYV